MKKLLLFTLLIGCSSGNRLVPVVHKSLQKTVMIEVRTNDVKEEVVFKNDKLDVKKTKITKYGAGVYITSKGHILTCAHILRSKKNKDVLVTSADGYIQKATILAKRKDRDLALIRVNAVNAPYARIADPRGILIGQEVIAIGNPLGYPFTVTSGIISALNRDFEDGYNLLQSDVSTNPGSSGGPLFNLDGELIAINSRIAPPVPAPIFTGLGFSVFSGQIVEFLTDNRKADKDIPKIDSLYWSVLWEVSRERKESKSNKKSYEERTRKPTNPNDLPPKSFH